MKLMGKGFHWIKKGYLKINEPSSPYHKMTAADYTEFIVKVWARKNSSLLRAHHKKIKNGEVSWGRNKKYLGQNGLKIRTKRNQKLINKKQKMRRDVVKSGLLLKKIPTFVGWAANF